MNISIGKKIINRISSIITTKSNLITNNRYISQITTIAPSYIIYNR